MHTRAVTSIHNKQTKNSNHWQSRYSWHESGNRAHWQTRTNVPCLLAAVRCGAMITTLIHERTSTYKFCHCQWQLFLHLETDAKRHGITPSLKVSPRQCASGSRFPHGRVGASRSMPPQEAHSAGSVSSCTCCTPPATSRCGGSLRLTASASGSTSFVQVVNCSGLGPPICFKLEFGWSRS
jgi:hypothetical protein